MDKRRSTDRARSSFGGAVSPPCTIPRVVDRRAHSPQESHTVVPLTFHRRSVTLTAAVQAPTRRAGVQIGSIARDASGVPTIAVRHPRLALTVRSADPAAQPRGRGVAARGDDAQPRGDHRRGRGAHRVGRLLQARARRTSSTRSLSLHAPRRAGRSGHGRRGAAPRRACSKRSVGAPTLLRIQAATPASANAAHYAQIVAELAMLRRLIGAAGDIQEMALRRAPTTSTRHSTAPSRWSSRSPSAASPTR